MSESNNGGPAFPSEPTRYILGGSGGAGELKPAGYPGMTLRDWFAGQAMQGLLAEPQPDDGEPELGLGREYATNAAKAAYRLADAMLAERSK